MLLSRCRVLVCTVSFLWLPLAAFPDLYTMLSACAAFLHQLALSRVHHPTAEPVRLPAVSVIQVSLVTLPLLLVEQTTHTGASAVCFCTTVACIVRGWRFCCCCRCRAAGSAPVQAPNPVTLPLCPAEGVKGRTELLSPLRLDCCAFAPRPPLHVVCGDVGQSAWGWAPTLPERAQPRQLRPHLDFPAAVATVAVTLNLNLDY